MTKKPNPDTTDAPAEAVLPPSKPVDRDYSEARQARDYADETPVDYAAE
jgi:hypothetical protein